MQVVWLPTAEANLPQIVEYIAEDNVPAALALAQLIRDRTAQLSEPTTLSWKGRVRSTRPMVVPLQIMSWSIGCVRGFSGSRSFVYFTQVRSRRAVPRA